jgi:hypothetical protein
VLVHRIPLYVWHLAARSCSGCHRWPMIWDWEALVGTDLYSDERLLTPEEAAEFYDIHTNLPSEGTWYKDIVEAVYRPRSRLKPPPASYTAPDAGMTYVEALIPVAKRLRRSTSTPIHCFQCQEPLTKGDELMSMTKWLDRAREGQTKPDRYAVLCLPCFSAVQASYFEKAKARR